jgi:hypothetical protein
MSKKKAMIGSWMTRERLEQKHRELKEQLRLAAQLRPFDAARVATLKKQKLLCKDLLKDKETLPVAAAPSAEVIPFAARDQSTESLFLGTPRLIASRR